MDGQNTIWGVDRMGRKHSDDFEFRQENTSNSIFNGFIIHNSLGTTSSKSNVKFYDCFSGLLQNLLFASQLNSIRQ